MAKKLMVCTECYGDGFIIEDIKCPECKGTGKVDGERVVFVNAYEVTRRYGGPEEGGWWYNNFDCIETYPTRYKNSKQIKEFLEKEYKDVEYGDIYSVLGGAALSVNIEDKPAESETRETPHYE